jgi:hypothetical protein
MEPDVFLSVADLDARVLLTAAETYWTRPVPHCPDWDAAGLVRHTGSIFEWADPTSETWTFSTAGDRRVGWWCRQLAVEVAIHRWDIEHAAAGAGRCTPRPLDGPVAAAGVEEFVVEFLPGLLAQEGIKGIGGTLQLHATDAPVEWWIDLDAAGTALPDHAKPDTAVRGTRSDLLLWLTNRGPLDSLDVRGNHEILDRWQQLRR